MQEQTLSEQQILEFLRHKAYKPMTEAELAAAFGVTDGGRLAFQSQLKEMETAGQVVLTRTKRYGAPDRMNLVVGRLQGHPRGFGFIIPDVPELNDLYVGRENIAGAWNGDRVIARPLATKGGRTEGEIIRILERANTRVVGTFQAGNFGGFVSPDDPHLPGDILIPPGNQGAAKEGDTVVAEVISWPSDRRPAEGRITERLGRQGDPGVDILAIMERYGLSADFPMEVVAEAAGIPDEVRASDLSGRRDLRTQPIVTIDGEDAKDLDDAVFVEDVTLPNGGKGWRLGVHIADVSYYVHEGAALDREAADRGTSVYLVDRVIPMLPKRLSNGICSLNPQVDRLTLTCQMDVDERGRVVHYELYPSVIRTAERMTYTAVTAILEHQDAAAIARYEPLVPMFERMAALTGVLSQRRQRRGSIDLDLPEQKVILDDRGKPIEIKPVQRGIADHMIEEFMILANETVAEHFNRMEAPFCYRVHESPTAEKLEALQEFLVNLGYRLKITQKIHPKALQEITRQAEGTREQRLVHTVVLRSMKQARYGVENLGHFGLAASFYCHFTSPIRRYPDLLVHRVMRQAIAAGGLRPEVEERWRQAFPDLADHASATERQADEAERETVDLKKAEFMLDKVGQEFGGLISGVTAFGVFVALENGVEGLVHVSTMADDYYIYQEGQHLLIGERSRKIYRLGDPVRVVVEGVSVAQRQVNFVLAGLNDSNH
ncbi:MAG: ribonuclease R [Symbiobacteriia bacterium]